jgi:hypothetical protein
LVIALDQPLGLRRDARRVRAWIVRTSTGARYRDPPQEVSPPHVLRCCGIEILDPLPFLEGIHQPELDGRGLVQHGQEPDVAHARSMGAPLPPAYGLPIHTRNGLTPLAGEPVELLGDIVQRPAAL